MDQTASQAALLTVIDMYVRPARAEDRGRLLGLWERSVRATHRFPDESDTVALRPLAAGELAGNADDWWVLISGTEALIAFWVSRTMRSKRCSSTWITTGGGGRFLVAHAQSLGAGKLEVDVNEQNEAAVRFYGALGFSVVGRSPTDADGRPFPTLHMKRAAPGEP